MKIIMFFGRHKDYHLQKMAKTGYLGMPVDGIWMNCMKISGMQFAKLALYLTHNKSLMVHQPNNNNSCSAKQGGDKWKQITIRSRELKSLT